MNTEKSDNRCPLCNSTVHYQGLVNLECSGRGCPNFKDNGFFGDVKVDWHWFNEFVAWFNSKTSQVWMPEMMIAGERFQMRRVDHEGRGSNLWLIWVNPSATRKTVKEEFSQEKFPNGSPNPYWTIFDL